MLFVTHDIDEALLLADTVYVMTARPGPVKKRIPVALPRPRTMEATTSPLFDELKREVLALIRDESVRAGRRYCVSIGDAPQDRENGQAPSRTREVLEGGLQRGNRGTGYTKPVISAPDW